MALAGPGLAGLLGLPTQTLAPPAPSSTAVSQPVSGLRPSGAATPIDFSDVGGGVGQRPATGPESSANIQQSNSNFWNSYAGSGQFPTSNQAAGGFNLGSIDTFPGVLNALALEQQGLGQLNGQLNDARQRAIINFGDPTLASEAGFGIDPQAAAFAQQNYLSGNSTLARLDHAHQIAQQQVINRLAAHGILNSGDLGYLEGQENQSYGNNVYDAQQAVLDQLSTLYGNYLNGRYGLESNANNAQLQALQDFLSNPDAYAQLTGQQQQQQQSVNQVKPPTATKTVKPVKTAPAKSTATSAILRGIAGGYGIRPRAR